MGFIYFNPNPQQKVVGDCTIRAISLLTEQDWKQVYISLASLGFEEYFNVSRAVNAQVWAGCCETITIRNTSPQPILVQNANVIFSH